MQDLITESWLLAYPAADVAITNLGGMRDMIPPGEITIADIVSVMPFENVLIEVKLTGGELLRVLAFARGSAAIGGVRQEGIGWVFKRNGEPVDTGMTYSLLVNDFMYAGGDDYTILAEIDPSAYDTGINWRQPVIDWIATQDSSINRPVDTAVRELGTR